MARNGAAPHQLGRTHPEHKTPHIAIILNVWGGASSRCSSGWKWGPLTGVRTDRDGDHHRRDRLYIFVCLGTIVYYLRDAAAEFNPCLHLIFPILGALAFLPPLYYTFTSRSSRYPVGTRTGSRSRGSRSASLLTICIVATQRPRRWRTRSGSSWRTRPSRPAAPATRPAQALMAAAAATSSPRDAGHLGVRARPRARARGRARRGRPLRDERLLHRPDPQRGRPGHRDRLRADQQRDRPGRRARRGARRLARRGAPRREPDRVGRRDADPGLRAADRPGAGAGHADLPGARTGGSR